jgi:hypothetical protein
MLDLVCIDDSHYESIMSFIEEHKLEEESDRVFAEEYENKICKDLEEVIDKYGMEVIDALSSSYLKKIYPEDYWKRSLVYEESEYSEGFKIITYRLDCYDRDDAIKFISGLVKQHEINTVDLFENGIKDLE